MLSYFYNLKNKNYLVNVLNNNKNIGIRKQTFPPTRLQVPGNFRPYFFMTCKSIAVLDIHQMLKKKKKTFLINEKNCDILSLNCHF